MFAPETPVEEIPLAEGETAPVVEVAKEVVGSEADLKLLFTLSAIIDAEEDPYTVKFDIDTMFESIITLVDQDGTYTLFVDMVEYYTLKGPGEFE